MSTMRCDEESNCLGKLHISLVKNRYLFIPPTSALSGRLEECWRSSRTKERSPRGIGNVAKQYSISIRISYIWNNIWSTNFADAESAGGFLAGHLKELNARCQTKPN